MKVKGAALGDRYFKRFPTMPSIAFVERCISSTPSEERLVCQVYNRLKIGMPPVPKPQRKRQRNFLREWREHRKYNQTKAAEMIGCSQGLLSRIESGVVPFNQDFLELAAEAYKTDVASLLMRNPLQPDAIWTIWDNANTAQRDMIVALAKTILAKTGT